MAGGGRRVVCVVVQARGLLPAEVEERMLVRVLLGRHRAKAAVVEERLANPAVFSEFASASNLDVVLEHASSAPGCLLDWKVVLVKVVECGPGLKFKRDCPMELGPFEFAWFTAVASDSEVSIAAL